MPNAFKKLTPNLVASDVERSLAFYRDVLGFSVDVTVPKEPPFVFVALTRGSVQVYLNSREAAEAEYPPFKGRSTGGTLTLFIEVTDVSSLYAALRDKVTIVMPLVEQWYGTTEFAFEDPDGYIVTLAEHGQKPQT